MIICLMKKLLNLLQDPTETSQTFSSHQNADALAFQHSLEFQFLHPKTNILQWHWKQLFCVFTCSAACMPPKFLLCTCNHSHHIEHCTKPHPCACLGDGKCIFLDLLSRSNKVDKTIPCSFSSYMQQQFQCKMKNAHLTQVKETHILHWHRMCYANLLASSTMQLEQLVPFFALCMVCFVWMHPVFPFTQSLDTIYC